jgi:hypothetical protein
MKRLAISTLALTILTTGGLAQAESAFTAGKPSLAGHAQYGIFTGDGELNYYSLGLGLMGGTTLEPGVYLGGRFDYFLGGSEDTFSGELSVNIWQLMGEVGYDVRLGPEAALRPKLGLGVASVRSESCISMMDVSSCGGDTESKFAVAPGAQLLYSLGLVFISADARFNHVFVDDVNVDGFLLGAGVGAAF